MNLSNERGEQVQPSTLLNDPASTVIADASAAISITASAYAAQILRAIPNRLIVSDVVVSELESGIRRGHANAEQLHDLIDSGLVEIETMGAVAALHFEELVVGPARNTLDDGEAATIASALELGAVPLIDESKARRICAQRYPNLLLGCTTDVFLHPAVGNALGDLELAAAVLNALQKSRMRVLEHHLAWVVNLIGLENAASCTSLPLSIRMQFKATQFGSNA